MQARFARTVTNVPLAMLLGLLAGAGLTSIPWVARAAGEALDTAEAATQSAVQPYWAQMSVLPGHQYRLLTVYLVVLTAAGALGLAQHRRGLTRLGLAAGAGTVLSVTVTLAVHQVNRGAASFPDAAVASIAIVGTLIVLYESLRGGRMRSGSERSQ